MLRFCSNDFEAAASVHIRLARVGCGATNYRAETRWGTSITDRDHVNASLALRIDALLDRVRQNKLHNSVNCLDLGYTSH